MSNKTKEEVNKNLIARNVEEIIRKESLIKRLKSKKTLRIKHGVDPTGPNIHIGRAIQFWKLKDFQDAGHKIVLIIGDFTAQIGDASDKKAMRRALSEKEVKENMKNYTKQIGKILDMSRVEIHHNSEWLGRLSAKELIKISMSFTAQQLIQRRNFKERWDSEKPIGLHELDYPLLQGYDSMAIKADVEVGGTDQLFNLIAGRKVQEIYGQKPQDVITLKMLHGLDGRKMSTSWGNIITINDKPTEMYGKIMSMKDELIPEYFALCTKKPTEEIREIEKLLKNKKVNPRDLKKALAKEIIILYYDKKSAQKAEREFEKVFKEKKPPSKVPEIKIQKKEIPILDLLTETKLTSSKGEARRLIKQKGVKIDGETQDNWKKIIKIEKPITIRAGKRKYLRVSFSDR
ncbi:MAG TPA: tyrosine--tRNA ligase [Candidatus Parcubacteria bacterium]|nr:tyrosine--tRNA ligase [Candidatus Parcubacteria bacterium]